MPKQTPREPGPDELASQRIRYERERRGWSTAELARRVTEAGCKINQSSVWAIESGEPRRRVSLGEAVAFAQVLGMTLDELMTAPDELRESAESLSVLLRGMRQMREDLGSLLEAMKESLPEIPGLIDSARPAAEHLGMRDLLTVDVSDIQAELSELSEMLISVSHAVAASAAAYEQQHAAE